MDNALQSLVTVAVAIIGVAIIAVLVSKQAQTGALIQNLSVGLATDLQAAVSPLSSGGFTGGNNLQFASSY